MTKLIYSILVLTVIASCTNNNDNQFVGTWQARFDQKNSIMIRFNDDGTFHFEMEEGRKPFGGVYYIIPSDHMIALDNRESKANEDAVGKYKFNGSDNLEILFLGLQDTTRLELTKVKR